MKKEETFRKGVAGSLTVEMSFLVPLVLFLIMGCILVIFYYHDKNILAGAAYETAVVGSTKDREKEGVKAGELEALFAQRVGGKCILFSQPEASIRVSKEEVEVKARASSRRFSVYVERRAAVTEPEDQIREQRRWKDGT